MPARARFGTLAPALLLALVACPLGLALADDAPPAGTAEPGAESTVSSRARPEGFRFHGYLRSGFGVSGEDTPQEAFFAPNAEAKYRLGNETEAYVETGFAYGIAAPEDPFFDTRMTISYVTPTSRSNLFATTLSLREAWALGRGVIASQPDASFWAGSRFYDRHDLYMSDFYYRDMSGFGGGVEDLRWGGARVALAWLGGSTDELASNGAAQQTNQFQFNKSTFDLRLYDIAAGGRLAVALDLAHFGGDSIQVGSDNYVLRNNVGWAAALFHARALGKGRNRLSLQYGTGVASDFRAVITRPPGRTFTPGEIVDPARQWQVRVVEDLVLDAIGPISLLVGGVYREIDNGAAQANRLRWCSLGLRPAWHFNRHVSVQLEMGLDHTSQPGALEGTLVKATLAPQITPSAAALVRPSIRAYLTWARWSNGFVGQVAPINYGGAQQGFALGVQLESWW
jgi:maltoporin